VKGGVFFVSSGGEKEEVEKEKEKRGLPFSARSLSRSLVAAIATLKTPPLSPRFPSSLSPILNPTGVG